ncbi:MAG: hypothetical protein U5K75_02395 [Ahrensia sp.]|nr:hypothetical protein [Ahrensia sp.]
MFYIGTIIHFDAVLARKAKSPDWKVTKFQAIMQWPLNMPLWERFEEIYHNEGVEAAKAFYGTNKKALDEGAVTNWPSMQSLLFLIT